MSALGFAAGNPLAWLAVLMVVGSLGNGLRLRARAKSLGVVPPCGTADPGAEPDVPRDWLIAGGVQMDSAAQAALAAFADREGLEVLDVVPGDLPVDCAMGLLKNVEPATFRSARLAPGRGSGQAVLATREVLRRAEIKPAEGRDPAAVLRDTVELKKFAPTGVGLATSSGVRAGGTCGPRATLLALGIPAPVALAGPLIGYAALAVGTAANPVWGIAALAAFSAQPYVVFAGTALRPRDLHVAALLRVVRDPAQWVRTAWGPRGVPAEAEAARRQARIAQSRPAYAADIGAGVDRFLEPPRSLCPWCGSQELARLLSAPDLHQGKPGRFRLDRCRGCGHVFQNPRLSIAGLDFYYRDFYDGTGERQLESAFGAQAKTYRSRAEMLRPYTKAPQSWLDVGTGYGHFCTVARDVWPGTAFDGLDMTDGIEVAARRGWVDQGFRGMFPDLAGQLAGSYDVVSMSHYLEHTREPFQELDAAAVVLKPSGHLLIEVPDPQWPIGRVLRRFWLPWLQPQHQHLIPIGNLKEALGVRGLVPVGELRTMNRVPFDLVCGVYLLMHRWTKDPDTPWARRRAGRARRILRAAALVVVVPMGLVAGLLDVLISLPLSRLGRGTAYRVIARKQPRPGEVRP